MKSVLVTGGTGFVGRGCLQTLLAHGWDVHALTIDAKPIEHPNLHWHFVDLLIPGQIAQIMSSVRPESLLHLAWYVAHDQFWTSPENLRWVSSSLDLFQEFVRNGGKRMVAAGSCSEYDWNYGYCSEVITPTHPRTLYGICKHSLQQILSYAAREVNVSFAWGRIFFLYGPNEHPKRLVAYIIRSLLREESALVTKGDQIRDFIYVDDASNAFVALLESDIAGIVNIASGQPIRLCDLDLKIGKLLNRTNLIEIGAIPSMADAPPLLIADVRRLREELKWTPRFDLETGLQQTISWWKEQKGNI